MKKNGGNNFTCVDRKLLSTRRNNRRIASPINIDMCFRVNILTVVDKCTVTTSDLLYASSHSQTFCISIVSPRATKRGTAAILSHATILRLHTVLEAKRKERNQQQRRRWKRKRGKKERGTELAEGELNFCTTKIRVGMKAWTQWRGKDKRKRWRQWYDGIARRWKETCDKRLRPVKITGFGSSASESFTRYLVKMARSRLL